MIWRYCFEENSSVRTWYTLLGGRNQAFMTMDTGCWLNFMHKMREIWSKPMAVAQREAEDRPKLPEESYYQFFFTKLKLLTSAFPESLAATHLSRIRSKFDADADKFICECQSIATFGEECREYDEHLKFHPVARNRQRFTYPTMYPPSGNPNTNVILPTLHQNVNQLNPHLNSHQNTDPNPNLQRKQTTWPTRFERRVDNRLKTVIDRMDLTTGKKTCSFQ